MATVAGWTLLALIAGAALGFGSREVFFKPETRVISAGGPAPTPEQTILARSIPKNVGPCKATEPLTDDFSAGFVCLPRDSAVTRVLYYRPKSGSRMAPYFHKRADAEGLGEFGVDLVPVSNCGAPPALRDWRSRGQAGHRPVGIGETGADGRFMCYRQNSWAAIEWTDPRVDVYSIAYGQDLIGLRRWWEAKAGPIQPD
jgi:hypothetical protein